MIAADTGNSVRERINLHLCLEVQPGRKRESTPGNCIVRLVRARRIRSGQPAEVDVVDVGSTVNEVPPRIVHHAERVHTDFEFLAFRQANPLHQVHIEIRVRGSFDPLATHCPDNAGSRAGENRIAVGVLQDLIRKRAAKRLRRRDIAACGVGDLLKVGEVRGPVRCVR